MNAALTFILNGGGTMFLRLGLLLRLLGFRRELDQRLDNGTVELWGTQFGIDEDGCVCPEAACSQRFLSDEA